MLDESWFTDKDRAELAARALGFGGRRGIDDYWMNILHPRADRLREADFIHHDGRVVETTQLAFSTRNRWYPSTGDTFHQEHQARYFYDLLSPATVRIGGERWQPVHWNLGATGDTSQVTLWRVGNTKISAIAWPEDAAATYTCEADCRLFLPAPRYLTTGAIERPTWKVVG